MTKKEKAALFNTEVIESGRVTIPKDFREAWGILEGDHVTLLLVANHGNPYKKVEAPKQ